MKITSTDFEKLNLFKKNLEDYQLLSNSVYRLHTYRDYPSDEEVTSRIDNEKKARNIISTEYGELEDLINSLNSGRPQMAVPMIPGYTWDVFTEAFSSDFNSSTKGECLEHAVQIMSKVVGKAKRLMENPLNDQKPMKTIFDDDLLGKINSEKIKVLCIELNNVIGQNPNASALLFRTILLLTLRHKLGSSVNPDADLGPVLDQSINSDVYKDRQIKHILNDIKKLPKTLLDATHHSQWILVEGNEIDIWSSGLKRIVEATFK